MTNTEAPSIDLYLREKIANLIRYHVSVTTSHHGQSYALENVDDAADAILALPGLQAEAPEDAEVDAIKKRHLYDEAHPWRSTDHKALAAHNDRACLLAKLAESQGVRGDLVAKYKMVKDELRTSQAEAQAPTTAAQASVLTDEDRRSLEPYREILRLNKEGAAWCEFFLGIIDRLTAPAPAPTMPTREQIAGIVYRVALRVLGKASSGILRELGNELADALIAKGDTP